MMTSSPQLRFRIASEPSDFEQIHRLNYRTFVNEIPQHEPREDAVLVDRFDEENTYVVCLRGSKLVGMIAARGNRPFSLDFKVPNLDSHLPPDCTPCEVRLLAVEHEHRTGVVFRGLVERLAQHCLEEGYDLGVISGTRRQLKLYRHLGFVPFGPLVGTAEARFQPMYLTLAAFRKHGAALMPPSRKLPAANFLPGPVRMAPEVREAVQARPVSHRGDAFVSELREVRAILSGLTGAPRVQVLLGSGTLANDAVAAQLSLGEARGLVLSNGEFGERLVDHATRWGLSFSHLRRSWGTALTRETTEAALDREEAIRWVWAAHCETSTGVLNSLPMLREVCAARGIDLCLDCVSSLGTVPLSLEGVRFATGTSSKGLGSLPGLSMVFHSHPIRPSQRLPRYLDLGLYAGEGVPFTHSSNLVRALRAALGRFTRTDAGFAAIERDAVWLRAQLRGLGFHIVARDADAAPAVTTVALPPDVASDELGERLEEEGYLLSYRSSYLRTRNWIQVCLMGLYPRDRLASLVGTLRRYGMPEAAGARGPRADAFLVHRTIPVRRSSGHDLDISEER